jgi:hypothetical protein
MEASASNASGSDEDRMSETRDAAFEASEEANRELYLMPGDVTRHPRIDLPRNTASHSRDPMASDHGAAWVLSLGTGNDFLVKAPPHLPVRCGIRRPARQLGKWIWRRERHYPYEINAAPRRSQPAVRILGDVQVPEDRLGPVRPCQVPTPAPCNVVSSILDTCESAPGSGYVFAHKPHQRRGKAFRPSNL